MQFSRQSGVVTVSVVPGKGVMFLWRKGRENDLPARLFERLRNGGR